MRGLVNYFLALFLASFSRFSLKAFMKSLTGLAPMIYLLIIISTAFLFFKMKFTFISDIRDVVVGLLCHFVE